MGSSSQEQVVDQHSADVNPHAWMFKYPVGTVITSNVYAPGDEYEVVSLTEWHADYKMPAGYLPVRLIKSASLIMQDPYDGFRESHIDSVVSKPQPKFDTVTLIDCTGGPWIPTPEELGWAAQAVHAVMVAKDSLKPQPKFGWWG